MTGRSENTEKRIKASERHYKRALGYKENGQLDEAISEMNKALSGAGDKAAIYRQLAGLHRSNLDLDNAIGSARKAIKLDPEDVESRELFIESLLQIGRYNEAISESSKLIDINPKNLGAREVLYMAYVQTGMLDKALQVTNELINIDPSSAANHYKKAFVLHEKGDIGSAIHELDRVLQMHPDAEMAEEAQITLEKLDMQQIRHIVMLAIEDSIFRAKLLRDPEAAALERGYYLSFSGMNALKQIQFDQLPDVYSEWKQRYYH